MTTQPKPVTSAANPSEQTLAIQKIYTKSSLFEAVAMTPALLKEMPIPVIDLQVQANYSPQEEGAYEAVLTLQLTAKVQGNLLWRIQLQQAGLYTFKGFSEEQTKQILSGHCMNQLYPYACSTVTALVTQGGFSPAYLAPMNFEALYREQQKQEKAAVAKAPAEVAH